MDGEKLSVEEFFRRVKAGEFRDAEVTVIDKPTILVVEEAGFDPWETGEALWYVGDEEHALYEGYADTVAYVVVTPKEGA